MKTTDKLQAALDYADRGWPVIPVRVMPGGWEKFPTWKEDPDQRPTTDTDEVSRRWSEDLDANPAICVGPEAGIFGLDWDPKNAPARLRDDPDPQAIARKMVAAVEEELGPLPETLTAITGSGGLHHYYRRPEALDAVGKANLDNFRLEGAVEVALGTADSGKLLFAPPSDRRAVKKENPHDRVYQWVDPEAEVAELPEAWVEAILEAAKTNGGSGEGFRLPEGEIHQGKGPHGGRDNTLWKYAGHLWKKGLAPAQILDALRRVNERCVPPLDDEVLRDKVDRTVRNGEPGHTNGYRATDQGLRLLKFDDGEVSSAEVLTNFTAEILRDDIVDNGLETRREFTIRAHLHGRRHDLTVDAGAFDEMGWPIEEIGARAVVEPYKKGKAQAAIQHLSPSVESRLVFAHLGWRKVGGEWLYLFHGGAIGKDGPVGNVNVRMGLPALQRYRLPAPPTGDELREAVEASLALLDLLPDRVMIPALSAVASAPLSEIVDMNFSLFFVGKTGSYKTEVSALLQGFFGDFDATTLPASWSSTAKSIERILSDAKDAPAVIDDLQDIQKLQDKADYVLRGAANRQARQRLKSTTEYRAAYTQRALPIVTGEHLPQGESLRARFHSVRLRQGEMDTGDLTEAQRRRDDGVYRRAMAGYVRWLAQNFDELCGELPEDWKALRAMWLKDVSAAVHPQEPTRCAKLATGLETYLQFAEDVGVDLSRYIREAPLRMRIDRVFKREALGSAHEAGEQADSRRREDPGTRFLSLLRSALDSGRAYLKNADDPGQPPFMPKALGWEHVSNPGMKNGYGYRPSHGADNVGFIDRDHVYINPEMAYAVAHRLARETNLHLPGTVDTLLENMKAEGQLADYEGDRARKRKQIDKSRTYYAWIKTDDLIDIKPEDVPEEHARIMADDTEEEAA